MTRPPKRPAQSPGREDARALADDKRLREQARAADPRNPANYTLYTVRNGDTLTHIAATRVGVTPEDLRWLNDLPDDRIKAGQTIKLPTQHSLDRAKSGFDTAHALAVYMGSHGGELPPDVAHPPSLDEQRFGPGTHVEQQNGYSFTLDHENRTRKVEGTITLAPEQARSRPAQAAAGGSDRLPTDEGGHYIARRFNGPTEAFNHFAQDGNFNRSAYARIENDWARSTKWREMVHVTIEPAYAGTSQRPTSIHVYYQRAGMVFEKIFPNSRRARYDR